MSQVPEKDSGAQACYIRRRVGPLFLHLVVMPDEQGRYHFDELSYEDLPEYLGYLGGPLAPEEVEHYRKEQAQQEYLRSSVPAEDDVGQKRLLSLSQKSVR